MKRLDIEAFEVCGVEGKNSQNAVNIHGGDQTGIVNLRPDDAVLENKPLPFGIGSRRIGKQNESLFNLCNFGGRLRDRKAEPILWSGACADVPEL